MRPEGRGGREPGAGLLPDPGAGAADVPKKSSKENPPLAGGSLLGFSGTGSDKAGMDPRPPSSPNTESSEMASLAGLVGVPGAGGSACPSPGDETSSATGA